MSSLYLLLAAGATFGAVMMAGLALDSVHSQRRKAVRLLESQVAHVSAYQVNAREENMSLSFLERALKPLLSRATDLGRRLLPMDMREKISRKLLLAGSPEGWDVDRVAMFKVLGAGGGLLFGLVALRSVGGPVMFLFLTTVAAAVGFYAPDVVIGGKADRRQQAIRRSLPDTMDLLTISVEAGLGFDAALLKVTQNVPGPLSLEIIRSLQEMHLGIGRADAFRHLADRTEVEELRSFVLALVQADSFGVPIAKVLRAQANEIRVKRRQRAEEAGMKVPVKILFPLITCVLPSLFVVILGPGVIRIYKGFFGI